MVGKAPYNNIKKSTWWYNVCYSPFEIGAVTGITDNPLPKKFKLS